MAAIGQPSSVVNNSPKGPCYGPMGTSYMGPKERQAGQQHNKSLITKTTLRAHPLPKKAAPNSGWRGGRGLIQKSQWGMIYLPNDDFARGKTSDFLPSYCALARPNKTGPSRRTETPSLGDTHLSAGPNNTGPCRPAEASPLGDTHLSAGPNKTRPCCRTKTPSLRDTHVLVGPGKTGPAAVEALPHLGIHVRRQGLTRMDPVAAQKPRPLAGLDKAGPRLRAETPSLGDTQQVEGPTRRVHKLENQPFPMTGPGSGSMSPQRIKGSRARRRNGKPP